MAQMKTGTGKEEIKEKRLIEINTEMKGGLMD
jgi:hypothetical protein